MNLYRFDPTYEQHYEYAKELIQVPMSEDVRGLVSIIGGKIAGMVILNNWSHTSVQCHMAVSAPMCLRPPGLFHAVADFVFNQEDLHMMVGYVPSNNRKALRLNEKIGFVELARIPDGQMFGIDTVILTMRRDQCNFLPAQEQQRAA